MNTDIITAQAHATYRGITLIPDGPFQEDPMRDVKDLTLQGGMQRSYVEKILYTSKFKPAGALATYLPLYRKLLKTRYGSAIAPPRTLVESVSTTTFTSTAHPFSDTSWKVYPVWGETAPTLSSGSLSRTTAYYAKSLSADTYSIHTSAVDAAAGDNPISVSADGLGGLWWAHDWPCVVSRSTGVQRTYLNSVPVEFPDIVFNGGELFFGGDMTLNHYPKRGAAVADAAAAFYTEASSAYTPPTGLGSDVLTAQAFTLAWGSAPWDAITSVAGVKLSIKPRWKEKGNGIFQHVTDVLDGCDVTASFIPQGITVPQFMALWAEVVGAQLATGTDLVITWNSWIFTLKNAVAKKANPLSFQMSDQFVPAIEVTAQGTNNGLPPATIEAA